MKKIILLVILVFVLFPSCGAGVSDYIENLGDNYYYLREGGEYNTIYFSKSDSNTIDRRIISSGVEQVDFNDEHVILKRIISKNQVLDSINRDLTLRFSFIELLKKPIILKKSIYKNRTFRSGDSVIHRKLYSLGFNNKNSINDKKILTTLSDSIFRANDYLKQLVNQKEIYYIISKRDHKIYGGFDKIEFLNKRKKENVSNQLKLNK